MKKFESYQERQHWIQFAKAALAAVPTLNVKDLANFASDPNHERITQVLTNMMPASAAIAAGIADDMLEELKKRTVEGVAPDMIATRLCSDLSYFANEVSIWQDSQSRSLTEHRHQELTDIVKRALADAERSQADVNRFRGQPDGRDPL